MGDFKLKSTQFRKEREPTWRELERLLGKIDKHGVRSLKYDEMRRLPTLYHGVISSLSVARAISLDHALLEYLTNLACRAYVAVYSSKRRPREAVARFLLHGFPAAVRSHWKYALASTLIMLLGVICGFVLTSMDMERYYSFVDEAMAGGRNPESTTEYLRSTLYDEGASTVDRLHVFASFLFTHNAKVGIFSFSLGFVCGAPTLFLIFYNGLLLGSMASLFSDRGLGREFWAWVMPHGVTELFAICLCGAAGLAFGFAVVFPGKHSRLDNLALRGRELGQIVLGAVVMLFVAALIEGFFRQVVHSEAIRWSVALTSAVGLALYFAFCGRGGRSHGGH